MMGAVNRRGFLARTALAVAGIMATCQFMPELASAQTKRLGQEPRIFDVLAAEMRLSSATLPSRTVLDLLTCVSPLSFRVNLVQMPPDELFRLRVLRLEIDPLWTEAQVRRAFRIEVSKGLVSFIDHAGSERNPSPILGARLQASLARGESGTR